VKRLLLAFCATMLPTWAFAQSATPLWWCAPLHQFYPTVQTCPVPWGQVTRPPGLSQPAPQAQTTNDPHCELIADRARRDACFRQAGIPVVDCHHPKTADDVAFCRQVLSQTGVPPLPQPRSRQTKQIQPVPATTPHGELTSAACAAISDPVRRLACFDAKSGVIGRPPASTSGTAAASTRGATTAAPVEAAAPAIGSAATMPEDRLRPVSGQPLCIDQDALSTMILSGILAYGGAIDPDEVIRDGCQVIPDGAEVEVIERYASGTDVMRVVKVRVTSPKLRGPTIGFTVEMGK
jgi:hypothetical protein